MHKFSLIVSTLGERPDDLGSLMRSLLPQSDYVADVIVVDQNPDPRRVSALLQPFQGTLPIRRLRSQRGLSRARNLGLPLASGTLVAFPDDDCFYPEGLLQWASNWFEAHRKYDILAVGVNDAEGVPSGNRWPQDRCDIHPINAFRTTFSSSLFIRTGVAKSGKFDIGLGVGSGTPYGSGEETDYVLRLMLAGARARFDRTRHIVHPRRDMLSGSGSAQRAQSYGFGMGHLLRLHTLSLLWASFLTYNLARAGWARAQGNRMGSEMCLAQTRGLWQGFLAPVQIAADRRGVRALKSAAVQPNPSSLNPM